MKTQKINDLAWNMLKILLHKELTQEEFISEAILEKLKRDHKDDYEAALKLAKKRVS